MHGFHHAEIFIPSFHGLRNAWDSHRLFGEDTYKKKKKRLHFLSPTAQASEANKLWNRYVVPFAIAQLGHKYLEAARPLIFYRITVLSVKIGKTVLEGRKEGRNEGILGVKKIDTKTRKLLNMHNMLHPKVDVERLYIPRKGGERGLIDAETAFKTVAIGLDHNLRRRAISKEGA